MISVDDKINIISNKIENLKNFKLFLIDKIKNNNDPEESYDYQLEMTEKRLEFFEKFLEELVQNNV